LGALALWGKRNAQTENMQTSTQEKRDRQTTKRGKGRFETCPYRPTQTAGRRVNTVCPCVFIILIFGGIIVKKILSVVLAIGLCLGLAVTAAAADEPVMTFVDAGGVTHEAASVNSFIVSGSSASKNLKYITEGMSQLITADGTVIVDKNGKVVVPAGTYNLIGPFSNGLAYVYKDGKSGYIDKTGALAIPLEFDSANTFGNGLAAVVKDDKYFYIDTTGKTAFQLHDDYWSPNTFNDGLAAVWQDEHYGYIDTTGKLVIPAEYTNDMGPFAFSDGLAIFEVWEDNVRKVGYIDKAGTTVVPAEYDYVGIFREQLGQVEIDGKYGFLDKTGTLVIPAVYDSAGDFSEGLAPVRKDGKWGYIDNTGALVIPNEYNIAGSFNNGLAAVRKEENGKYGYIDKAGKEVIPFIYNIYNSLNYVYEFNDGVAWVGLENSLLLIDTSGNVIAGNSATAPVPPSPATAKPTSSHVLVNGTQTSFDAYNISDNNYFKLRDLAYVLSGTPKQFEVGYDDATKAITLTSGQSYTAVGGEMESSGTGNKAATPTSSKIYLDGAEISLTAYNIGGYNYFKLRDIGQAFDFGVDWDGASQTIAIDTGKGYTPG
jgi:hypothetical protein